MKRLSLISLLAIMAFVFIGCLEGEIGSSGQGCSVIDNLDGTTSMVCGADTSTVASGCSISVDSVAGTKMFICGTDTAVVTDGKDGADGIKGADGVDYATAGANCTSCHNEGTKIVARQQQYALSTHANGAHAEYGNRTSCAGCHTHEGFKEVIAGGTSTVAGTAAAFDSPTQPNCRTCHNIHTVYDSTDWSLTVTDTLPITMNVDATQASFGKANVCATCHQPRGSVPATDSVEISKYYGPHHSPQGSVIQGSAAYSFAGQLDTLPTVGAGHAVAVTNTCVACHMANEPDGLTTESGGHQFGMLDTDTVLNTVSCVACHIDAATTIALVTALQTKVDSLLTVAEALLTTKTLLIADYSKKNVTAADAGALWNYKMIAEDHSRGVHNPSFSIAVLENTIRYLTPVTP